MNPNKKIILIVLLGIGACLLSFAISRFFMNKDQANKKMLSDIQLAMPHMEHIPTLVQNFIQNADPETWRTIGDEMNQVTEHLDPTKFKGTKWEEQISELNQKLEAYKVVLGELYEPAMQLHKLKLALQGIGNSFAQEVENGIIKPFRKEEGLRIYDGKALDPLKSRVKDTAYDLAALFNRQKLLLMELLLNSDFERYHNERMNLSVAMARQGTQLRYIALLMADNKDIQKTIASLEKKIKDLEKNEKDVVKNFEKLTHRSVRLETRGFEFNTVNKNLSYKILEDTRSASVLYTRAGWGLMIALILCLSLLGAWLGKDIIGFVHDLNSAKNELQENEGNLRVTLNSIGDAVIATDSDGVVTRINPSAASLTGWDEKDAVGRSLNEVFRIVHAHTRERIPNPVDIILERGEAIGLANHTILISRDGNEYQIADSGAPIRHEDGATVGVVLVFRDVTEAYMNEQKLRDSERTLKNLTAKVPGVVYQYTADIETGALTPNFIGPNALEIFGIDVPDEFMFDTFASQIPEDEQADFLESIQVAIRTASPWSWTGRYKKPSGETIWFSGNAAAQREDDRVIFFGMLQNIMEQKRWEHALEDSEQRFKRLFNEAPMMYVINENRNGRPFIVEANDMFLELLGYERHEVTGAPLDKFFSEESARLMLEGGGYARSLNGVFEPSERDLVARDGRIIHTILHAVPEYDNEKRVVGTRAMFLDITQNKQAQQEAKRLEAALTQSQKMEAIGTLAGGIAHDFNNILAAVIGYSELAISKTEKGSPLHGYLEQILLAGLRAKDLVEQILAFSRQSERELKPLQVGSLVKEALKLLRSSLPATIEIESEIPNGLDNIMADPTQVHQIIMNLCTNASHAMEEDGGSITVRLGNVRLTQADVRLHPGLDPGKYVEIVVQDTGPGIPPEIKKNIFDPYFTTKKKGKGTGLGLSVVHGIVQSYGGAIQAYSEVGKGTVFNIYIPAVRLFQPQENHAEMETPEGSERILLVDDEPVLTEIGSETLERLGYTVISTNSAPEALELFKADPDSVDLVISDVTMPKMTGDQLTARLREIRPNLPVILCTGFSSKISSKQVKEIGAKALIMKPFVTYDLAKTVRDVLDNHQKTGA